MPDYRFRFVRSDGFVMHELGKTRTSLDEAQTFACQLARSVVAASPEENSWSEWCVNVTDPSGWLLLHVPFAIASGERPRSRESAPERPSVREQPGYSHPRHIGPRPWRMGP